MHFFKVTIAFISLGGATFALLAMDRAPGWVKFVSVALAISTLIVALPDLPRAIDAIKEAFDKLPTIKERPYTTDTEPKFVMEAPYSQNGCGLDPKANQFCCKIPKKPAIEWSGGLTPWGNKDVPFRQVCID